MKTVSLRALSRDGPTITEDVLVLHGRRIIGTFSPFAQEVPMDDIARKAIEPQEVKVQPSGRLSKGLGTIPGQEPPTDIKQFRPTFNPAPKPGKK